MFGRQIYDANPGVLVAVQQVVLFLSFSSKPRSQQGDQLPLCCGEGSFYGELQRSRPHRDVMALNVCSPSTLENSSTKNYFLSPLVSPNGLN